MLNTFLRYVGAIFITAMLGLSQAHAFTATSFAPGSNLGTLSPTAVSFYGLTTPPSAFSFAYTFDLAADSTVSGAFTPIGALTISSFSLGSVNPIIAANGLFSQFLSAGTYTMGVTGTGLGFAGTIAADLAIPPAAVPEANAVLMVLAGMAVAGVFLKRRSRSV
jgi:hypothetical protein